MIGHELAKAGYSPRQVTTLTEGNKCTVTIRDKAIKLLDLHNLLYKYIYQTPNFTVKIQIAPEVIQEVIEDHKEKLKAAIEKAKNRPCVLVEVVPGFDITYGAGIITVYHAETPFLHAKHLITEIEESQLARSLAYYLQTGYVDPEI